MAELSNEHTPQITEGKEMQQKVKISDNINDECLVPEDVTIYESSYVMSKLIYARK